MLCLGVDCGQRAAGGYVGHIGIHDRTCHDLITKVLAPYQLGVRLSVALRHETLDGFVIRGCRSILVDITCLIIFPHSLKGRLHLLRLKYILNRKRVVAVLDPHRILDQIHVDRRGITACEIHRHHVWFLLLDKLKPRLQILQTVDLLYRNLISVHVLLREYPHRHASDLFLAWNAVGLALYLRRLPETLVDILVHLGILDIIINLKEGPFVSVLQIIVRPGTGEAHIPVVACVDHYLHLLVIVSPSCRVDLKLYADLISDIFIYLLKHPVLILLCVSNLPPSQLHNLFSACVRLCLLLTAARQKNLPDSSLYSFFKSCKSIAVFTAVWYSALTAASLRRLLISNSST